jgi:hypothetical protein
MDSLGWAGLEPAQGWNENSWLGLSIPFTKLGQASAHPNEAMNSIKVLQQTRPALRSFEMQAPSAGPAAEQGVRLEMQAFGGRHGSRLHPR